MKRRCLSIFVATLLLVGLLGAQAMAAGVRFAVFADPHYYDRDLGTEGAAFEAYLNQDRKLIPESEALVKAVVDKIIAAHEAAPLDFVIVPGDLSKDGALTSHEEFAACLAQLKAAGIPVFVVPGNHDINNPHALAYDGDTATPVENVSPARFRQIYAHFGYNQAFAKAPDSLSYAVEPVPGVVLLGLDVCKYADNLALGHPEASGAFSPATLAWALTQIEKANAAGKQVIAFQHHSLTEHYLGQSQAFPEYVIDDWETVSATLADAGLKLVFTGHYHANDITEIVGNTDGARLYDIETGSLVTAPCPYRIVTLHGRNAAQVETRTITEIDYDTGGVPFSEYARNYLNEGLLGIAQYTLMYQYGLDSATATTLAPTVASAFAAHYAGDERPDDQTLTFIMGLIADPNPTTRFLGQSLYALWTDLTPADGRALLPLDPAISLNVLGSYASGFFNEGGAEIVAFDAKTRRLFVSNANDNSVDALDVSDPANQTKVFTIDLSPYGGGVNSVAVHDGIVAVAVEAEVKQDPGTVAFFDTDGNFLNRVTVGALPDMLTFTPDGSQVLVANEGEPNDDYSVDPEGSVSIVDISRGVERARVQTAGFERFNRHRDQLIASGVRIFGPNASVAQDLEPEYIAVAEGSPFAWVSLQENNAVACLNLRSGRITAVLPLGFKDHGLPGNGIDASNKDDGIDIRSYDNLFGMFHPDALAAYRSRGRQYLVTANEGDARDYGTFGEEERVADLPLDPAIFPNAGELQKNSVLGRLTVTATLGDRDGDGRLRRTLFLRRPLLQYLYPHRPRPAAGV